MDGNDVVSGGAWRAFCDRLAALGDQILGDDFPGDPLDRAEGMRHLATQTACWLTYATGYGDPAHPAFFRSADPTYAWGGPNVDQVARRATIDGSGTYRVSGHMGSCEEFVLQLKQGTTQSGGANIGTEVSASQLGLGSGDAFEITLSAAEQAGTWLPLGAGPGFVHVRDYYFDWAPAEPATFVIERLDTQAASAPRLTADRVAEMLETAAHEVEHSVVYFRDYQARLRDAQQPNEFGVPAPVGRGVQDIIYSHGFVGLGDDEALILELEPNAAALWGVSSYTRAWYEPLDYATRVTSRNHRQVVPDDDGLVRVVLAGRDPGSANWLDTEGRAEVLTTLRWFRPPDTPTLRTEVVPLAELAAHLPGGHPMVDPDARRAEIAGRAAHVAWRYRT
jgi:Protein of unknown function (DUF1214)